MFAGIIDLGSRDVKIAAFDGEGWFLGSYGSMDFYRRFGQSTKRPALDMEALELDNAVQVVVTGYGRLALRLRGPR
jgi:activator of 2-hydroxyglutaryl-CoA dehydratase